MLQLVYHGYDGAGGIKSYTSGFVTYLDSTQPLDLPVTEWDISLEVGKHIPSNFEGMLFRNINCNNCRRVIILSWGIVKQGGSRHINLYSNNYISTVFNQLGYRIDTSLEAKLRKQRNTHWWFTKPMMVFQQEKSSVLIFIYICIMYIFICSVA